MSDWQPIETAPDDGYYLVYGRRLGYWGDKPDDDPEIFICLFSFVSEVYGKRVFRVTETVYDESATVEATHWMQLPAHPEEPHDMG